MAVVNITLDVLRCLRCVRYSYTMFGVKRYSSHQLTGCRYSHYTVLLFMCCSRLHLMRTSTSVFLSACSTFFSGVLKSVWQEGGNLQDRGGSSCSFGGTQPVGSMSRYDASATVTCVVKTTVSRSVFSWEYSFPICFSLQWVLGP
jgi:hypothetical protein